MILFKLAKKKKKKISSTVHFFLRNFPVYVGSIYRKSMYTRFTSGAFTLEFLFLFFFVFFKGREKDGAWENSGSTLDFWHIALT